MSELLPEKLNSTWVNELRLTSGYNQGLDSPEQSNRRYLFTRSVTPSILGSFGVPTMRPLLPA
jgi:hypothetical protein